MYKKIIGFLFFTANLAAGLFAELFFTGSDLFSNAYKNRHVQHLYCCHILFLSQSTTFDFCYRLKMPTVVYLIFWIEFLYEGVSAFFVEAFIAMHW